MYMGFRWLVISVSIGLIYLIIEFLRVDIKSGLATTSICFLRFLPVFI